LPRQPGAREQRWTHLVCGEPAEIPAAAPLAATNLEERVARLEQEVAELRAMLESLIS